MQCSGYGCLYWNGTNCTAVLLPSFLFENSVAEIDQAVFD